MELAFARCTSTSGRRNFKGLLADIGLEDVAGAVVRARRMNEATSRRGARTAEHCGFTYCLDNPYTELHRLVGEILVRTRALPAGTNIGS